MRIFNIIVNRQTTRSGIATTGSAKIAKTFVYPVWNCGFLLLNLLYGLVLFLFYYRKTTATTIQYLLYPSRLQYIVMSPLRLSVSASLLK